MESNNVAIAALALTGTLATGFFALIAKQNKTHEKLAKSIDLMADASKEVAKATKQSAKEAEQRNGHLGELVQQGIGLTAKVLESHDAQPVRHVDTQIVDKQIVKGE